MCLRRWRQGGGWQVLDYADVVGAVDRGLRALFGWLRAGAGVVVPDTIAAEIVVPALIAQVNAHLWWPRLPRWGSVCGCLVGWWVVCMPRSVSVVWLLVLVFRRILMIWHTSPYYATASCATALDRHSRSAFDLRGVQGRGMAARQSA